MQPSVGQVHFVKLVQNAGKGCSIPYLTDQDRHRFLFRRKGEGDEHAVQFI